MKKLVSLIALNRVVAFSLFGLVSVLPLIVSFSLVELLVSIPVVMVSILGLAGVVEQKLIVMKAVQNKVESTPLIEVDTSQALVAAKSQKLARLVLSPRTSFCCHGH